MSIILVPITGGFMWHHPCNNQNSAVNAPIRWIFKTLYKKLHSLIRNHMRREPLESARERRIARSNSDHQQQSTVKKKKKKVPKTNTAFSRHHTVFVTATTDTGLGPSFHTQKDLITHPTHLEKTSIPWEDSASAWGCRPLTQRKMFWLLVVCGPLRLFTYTVKHELTLHV